MLASFSILDLQRTTVCIMHVTLWHGSQFFFNPNWVLTNPKCFLCALVFEVWIVLICLWNRLLHVSILYNLDKTISLTVSKLEVVANGSIMAATYVTTIACQVAQRTINTAKFLRQEGYWNLKTQCQKRGLLAFLLQRSSLTFSARLSHHSEGSWKNSFHSCPLEAWSA